MGKSKFVYQAKRKNVNTAKIHAYWTIQQGVHQLLRGRWNARLRALITTVGARRWAGATFKGERLINSRD